MHSNQFYIGRSVIEKQWTVEFPEASAALIASAISPYLFRYDNQDVVDSADIPAMKQFIQRELAALDWVKSNPNTALQFIKDNNLIREDK